MDSILTNHIYLKYKGEGVGGMDCGECLAAYISGGLKSRWTPRPRFGIQRWDVIPHWPELFESSESAHRKVGSEGLEKNRVVIDR